MATYRMSRNIEASIIQFIEDVLVADGWNNIRVEKSFVRVYDGTPPAICIRVSDTDHDSTGIGENTTTRKPLILVDIFATSDGQRLDLKDFLVSVLKNGMPYYEYITSGANVSSKIENGRLRVLTLDDTEVNLGTDKASLAVIDRYRHLLSLNMATGKVE
ncbi:MAG TPA: hypothetical protein ENI61_06635 [Ignavibacteria bacterium]|nr:hypothetical protein [Ignavibacteria bacterium]